MNMTTNHIPGTDPTATCEHSTEAACATANPLGHCPKHDFSVERYELECWGL